MTAPPDISARARRVSPVTGKEVLETNHPLKQPPPMNTQTFPLIRQHRVIACTLAFAFIAVLPLRAVDATAPAGIIITTSRSTLTLPALASLTTENSLRQAGRIAQIALGETLADCAALAPAEAAFSKDVEAYRQDDAAAKTRVDALDVAHAAKVEAHNADAAKQRALAQASNSLPADKRNPATVSRGIAWAQEIGRRMVALEAEAKANADVRASECARLTAISNRLVARRDILLPKLGAAYRQLKRCADYAAEVQRLHQATYPRNGAKDFVVGEPLVTAKEQLANLNARGWDTP